MAATLKERGTCVVPVAGKHEVQEKGTDAAGRGFKLARPGNEDAWRANMGDPILDTGRFKALTGQDASAFDPANTPQVGGADRVSTDQQQLMYSSDAGTFRGYQHRRGGLGQPRPHRLAGQRPRGSQSPGRGAFLRVRSQAGLYL